MTTNLLSVIEQQQKALKHILAGALSLPRFAEAEANAAIAAGEQALEQTQGETSEFDSPLSDFKEGQWWTLELDAIANSSSATHDQKRAIAVVRHLLRVIAATHPQATEPAPSCTRCGATTGQACNDMGCGYLEAGNGEPAPSAAAEFDAAIESARLLGVAEAKKGYGVFTEQDSRFIVAMYQSIAKHRAAILSVPALPAAAMPVGELTDQIADIIANNMYGVYHCTRVWEAWNIGTMSEEDFEPYAESDSPRELAALIVAALHPTQPKGE